MLQREGASIIVSDQMRLSTTLKKEKKIQYYYSIHILNTMRHWLNVLSILLCIYPCSDRCIIALSAMIILWVVSITWQHQDHSRLTRDRWRRTDQSEARSVSLRPIRRRHRASVWSDVRGEREQVLQHLLIAFIHEVLKTISHYLSIGQSEEKTVTMWPIRGACLFTFLWPGPSKYLSYAMIDARVNQSIQYYKCLSQVFLTFNICWLQGLCNFSFIALALVQRSLLQVTLNIIYGRHFNGYALENYALHAFYMVWNFKLKRALPPTMQCIMWWRKKRKVSK